MILLDTHTWLWLLHDPTQLSDPAQTIIIEAENNNSILISSISVWEIEQNADIDLESPAYPYPDDFWQDAELVSPQQPISICLDKHIIDYFKRQDSDYQKRINEVLNAYISHQNRVEK